MYWLKILPISCFIKFFASKNNLKIFFFFKNKVYSYPFNSFHTLFLCNYTSFFLFTFKTAKMLSTTSQKIDLIFKGLLKNWITGLNFIGVGFRFIKISQKAVILKLGLSHLIKFYFNPGVKIFRSTRKPTKIFLVSSNKFFLTKIASSLKLIKLPDNYKGKGLVSSGEVITIKKREKFGSF